MNLDGETNLKDREVPVSITEEEICKFSGKVNCDTPNANLDLWEGIFEDKDGQPKIASIKNLLLRGVTLKNIEYAYGVCLYVG